MKKVIFAVLISLTLCAAIAMAGTQDQAALISKLSADIDANAKLKPAVKEFLKSKINDFCTNAVFIQEVQKKNAAGASLDDIKSIDAQWQSAEEELAIMTEVMGNACAQEIKKLAGTSSAITEAFVMDNQGAVVGENSLTSDYWQGDEPKWQNSFNGGKGGIDVGDEKFDRSANAVIQQVSLPVISSTGEVIGAITIGLDIAKL